MGEHHFGGGNGKVERALAKKVAKIAAENGADFTCYQEPNGSWRFWFSCENRGSPFDQWTADRVYAALDKAGLSKALFGEE